MLQRGRIISDTNVTKRTADGLYQKSERLHYSRYNEQRCVITRSQGTRDSSHKDGLAGIKGLRSIHHKVTVTQVPRPNLHLESRTNCILDPLCLYEDNPA